eukprot:570490-Pleurochrysis_carterae.AAC.2
MRCARLVERSGLLLRTGVCQLEDGATTSARRRRCDCACFRRGEIGHLDSVLCIDFDSRSALHVSFPRSVSWLSHQGKDCY